MRKGTSALQMRQVEPMPGVQRTVWGRALALHAASLVCNDGGFVTPQSRFGGAHIRTGVDPQKSTILNAIMSAALLACSNAAS